MVVFKGFGYALEATQIQSRIERDVKQRGYTHKEAMALFESLKPHYAKYIEPTKKFASVVVEVSTDYVVHPTHLDDCLR